MSVISVNGFASVKTLGPCSSSELKDVKVSIKDWAKNEGYNFAYYMKNPKGQVVGFYVTDHDESMYAEVCDYVNTELVTSTSWYYWDELFLKANPASWKAKAEYRLSQDEGFARIKMIKADKSGRITAEFKVMGFGADADKETLLMKEIVKFEPTK